MEGNNNRNMDNSIRSLLDNMPYDFAYCKFIANENDKPEDFFFLEINKAFEDIICLKRNEVIGKRVKELYPLVDKASLVWIEACDKIAFDLVRVDFEYHVSFLKKWYSVTAYSSQKYSFSAILHDITDMKQKDEALTESKKKYSVLTESTKLHAMKEKWLIGMHEYLLNKN